jgi:hypothetical protein
LLSASSISERPLAAMRSMARRIYIGSSVRTAVAREPFRAFILALRMRDAFQAGPSAPSFSTCSMGLRFARRPTSDNCEEGNRHAVGCGFESTSDRLTGCDRVCECRSCSFPGCSKVRQGRIGSAAVHIGEQGAGIAIVHVGSTCRMARCALRLDRHTRQYAAL